MKIEEILEKIKDMKPVQKLDFLFKIYNETEDKEELEKLIRNTMDELSSERTPIDINLEFENIKEEKTKGGIEEKIKNESTSKENLAEYQSEYITVKFIPEEDVAFWVEGSTPSKKYYKPLKTKKYEVVW